MRKITAAVLAVMVMVLCGGSWADDGRYVREEASRRNIQLIGLAEVKKIAEGRFEPRKVHFKDIDLENEADDYPNGSDFRPVYQIECESGGHEYDVDIDAVTGVVLKLERDD